MKRKCLLVLLMLMMVNICACGTENTTDKKEEEIVYEYKVPEVDKDLVKVFANHADYVFGNNNSYRNMSFTMVSSQKITDKDEVEVVFEPNIPCEVIVGSDCEEDVIPFEMFEAYQGDVWLDFAKENKLEIYDLKSIYDANLEKLPVLYRTQLIIRPTMNTYSDLSVTSMTISINGVKTTYEFDEIRFTTDVVENENSNFLTNMTIAMADLNYRESSDPELKEKVYMLSDLQFETTKDLKINRVYFWGNEDISFHKISVDSNGMNYVWDMAKPITLTEDEKITLNLEVRDAALEHYSSFNRMLIVEYEMDGKTYNTFIDVSVRMRDNAFTMLFEEGVLK